MGSNHWKAIALATFGVSTLSVGIAIAQPAHRGPQAQGQQQQHGGPSGQRGRQSNAQAQGGGGGQGGQQGGGEQGGQGPTSRPSLDALFDEADSNKDGSLSRDEFKEFIKSHRPPRPGARGGQGGGGGGVQGGGGGQGGGEEGGNRPPPPPPDNQ
jgi:hypothetical protein